MSQHQDPLELALRYWGKAQPEEGTGPRWHPLPYHMLDVAAVAHAMLTHCPGIRRRTASLLQLVDDDAARVMVLVAALHDLGKFSRAFQSKVPELHHEKPTQQFNANARHDAEGWLALDAEGSGLLDQLTAELWPLGRQALGDWLKASVAHHGRPVSNQASNANAELQFGKFGLQAIDACVSALLDIVGRRRIERAPPKSIISRRASWWVSGLVTVADWVGSSQRWFPYTEPSLSLQDYWCRVLPQAKRAIREAGLIEPRPAAPMSFSQLTGISSPSPVQAWAESVELPDGPLLVIVEDVTGAGKTEAAQMLVHRLMAEGRASGAFWALPTQATANAMYERQTRLAAQLFAPQENISLVLAHGQSRLSERFQRSILPVGANEHSYTDVQDAAETTASAACAAFLAHDRRMSMLADVGSGTIDQALLAALPSKFNTIRLFGLVGKVLVIDEAHAYDAYMSGEIEALLAFIRSLGGCAIVLSATLPEKKRQDLIAAWGGASGPPQSAGSDAYPLVTLVGEAKAQAFGLKAAQWSTRSVPVRMLHNAEDAVHRICDALARGGAVAWVRNTVDDVLEAAALLRDRGVQPLVFHARFAQCDRQAIESRVLSMYGKDAPQTARVGQVIVATQVIEQSLDLDFDLMISDLAPIDLLVQRAGRLRRHPSRNVHRPGDIPFEFMVLAPVWADEPDADWFSSFLKRASRVYEHPGILWNTARVLREHGAISTPDNLRALIEGVYADDVGIPPGLEAASMRAMGREMGGQATAEQVTLRPESGYTGEGTIWLPEQRVRTRLGDEDGTVRLARIKSDGSLGPWAEGAAGESWMPEWKRWALSEVRIAGWRLKGVSQAPEHLEVVNRAKVEWSAYERDCLVVPLQQVSPQLYQGALAKSDGAFLRINYDARYGINFD